MTAPVSQVLLASLPLLGLATLPAIAATRLAPTVDFPSSSVAPDATPTQSPASPSRIATPEAFPPQPLILQKVSPRLVAQVNPAADGTNTVVTPDAINGNAVNITGGQTSGDLTNLFHSFSQFGLDAGQLARFIANPDIRNILARVTGGNASVINGTIVVSGPEINPGFFSGSSANLFLMNPAGIVFGGGASLNVQGSFTATTANAIGFGDQWFNAIGANNFATLLGDPTTFAFSMTQPGAIVNGGSLSVGFGQRLSLLGGSVVNTGQIQAEGGQVVITAVPGTSLLRISQPGSPLSLEITAPATSTATPWTLPIASLPQLLTGSGISVPGAAVGAVVSSGQISTSSFSADSGSGVLIVAEGNIMTGSNGPNTFDPVAIDTRSTFSDSGTLTLLSRNGAIDTRAGTLRSDSGTGNGGAITLTARDAIFTADVISFDVPDPRLTEGPVVGTGTGGDISLTSRLGSIDTTAGLIRSGGIADNDDSVNISGNVTLSALGNLNLGGIQTHAAGTGNAGRISLTSSQGSILGSGALDASSSNGNGGDITLSALQGSVAIASSILSLSGSRLEFDSQLGNGNGGAITVQAANTITLQQLDSSSVNGAGGNVFLDPTGDIQVDFINAQGGTRGGNVDITTDRFFRAISSFVDRNQTLASISTAAPRDQGGTVIIRHGGGRVGQSFDVGNASTNGTAAAITRGTGIDATISQQQRFPIAYKQDRDRLQIITPEPLSPPKTRPVSELDSGLAISLPCLSSEAATADTQSTRTFEKRFKKIGTSRGLGDTCATLSAVESNTGIRPGLIYVSFVPETVTGSEVMPKDDDKLELILVTAKGPPIRKRLAGVTRSQVLATANQFRLEVSDKRKLDGQDYLKPAQQLYQYLIAPLAADLELRKVQNLAFVMDDGLRALPVAALHDGQRFLVEKYSLGLMPSINLTDTRYVDVRNTRVLAMGSSKFNELNDLPAVPTELSLIQSEWQAQVISEDNFTLKNLRAARSSNAAGIVHLATHGEFRPGDPANSFIQFRRERLGLDQLEELGFSDPPTELLVLSACRTALGDRDAELGFAGITIQSGAKSALGSLWYVSDLGTLTLMGKFYEQLRQVPLKAEALRQAQIAMLKGQVRVEDGKILGLGDKAVVLDESLAFSGDAGDLTHPFFWSAFTLVGNPW